jgi:Tfp pilus assembly protein PilN
MAFLFLVCVLSMVLFLLVLASPLPRLKQDENAIISTLSGEHEKVARYTLLTSRLGEVTNIMNKRTRMKETISLFRSQVPDDAQITTLSIDQKTVKLTASSSSLESLQTYLAFLTEQVEKNIILHSLKVNNLSLTQDGYTLEVTITLL